MLQPASVAVNLIPRAWAFIRSAWPLLLLVLFGTRPTTQGLIDFSIIAYFFMAAVGSSVLHFLTLRYRVEEGQLEVKTGLLNRQVRVILASRVQNVEMIQNIYQRLAGLVEVRIETASGSEVEGLLSALTREDAEALVSALSAGRGEVEQEEDEPAPLIEMRIQDLLLYGATSPRLRNAIIAFGVLTEAATTLYQERVTALQAQFGSIGLVVLAVMIMIGTWFTGIFGAVARHYGYRLTLLKGGLLSEEGLFTKRRIEVPLSKVQVVAWRQPFVRRLLGFGSLTIETAVARVGRGGIARALALIPALEMEEVPEIVQTAMPGCELMPMVDGLQPPNARARWRALFRSMIQSTIFASLIAWWWWPYGLAALLMIPGFAALAWIEWSFQGWTITDDFVVTKRGVLDRTLIVVSRDKLQSVEYSQGPLLRSYRLGQVILRVAGNAIRLPLMDEEEAFEWCIRLADSIGQTNDIKQSQEEDWQEAPTEEEGLLPSASTEEAMSEALPWEE